MKVKKILSLILAVIMICTAFLFACGDEEEQTGTGSTMTAEPVDESKQYTAEIKNLNGHEFLFWVRGTDPASHLSTHAVYAEKLNGDVVNDAVFERNAQLEKTYNCTIKEERHSDPAKDIREALLAGDYVCDFIMSVANATRSLTTAGLLVDFSTLKNIDLSKAWWDQNASAGMNLGGKIYFVTGDACTLDDRAAWIMWFNRDIIAECDPNLDLYQTVRDGKWTVALMAELMQKTAKDETGDGVISEIEKDRFGYVGEDNNNWFHIASCNVTLVKYTPTGMEIPRTPNEDILKAWEACRGILASPLRYVSDSGTYFKNGKATFYACNVGTMLRAGETAVNMGFLPMPKLNEEQKNYHTGVSYYQLGCYSIPITVENAEKKDWQTNGFESAAEQCAYFLDAFAYYSMNTVTPAFYNQVLLRQAVRDEGAAEMVEIALAHKVYDPIVGYNLGSMNAAFRKCGSPGGKDSVGTDSAYDTIVSGYEQRIGNAINAYEEHISALNQGQAPAQS